MILVTGGTGNLGRQVVCRLADLGLQVRVLTRDSARAKPFESTRVEIVEGDVRDARAVERAVDGVDTIVSAVHGFVGDGGPAAVDWLGNRQLIKAAQAAGVEHFVLISVHGAAADHPMELFRMKYRAEQELRASGLAWTIIRATAFMELYGGLIGGPLVNSGRTRIFGRGDNPINFVSVHDVAQFVDLAVTDPSLRDQQLDVGGPENLSLNQLAHTFEIVTGKTGTKSHVPLAMMRLLSVALRPIQPAVARQIQAGVLMDTSDMACDGADRRRFPSIGQTTVAEMVKRDYVPRMQV
jgi:uncharacterized protein YbjT (DUF2867 family)